MPNIERMDSEELKTAVRELYAKVAEGGSCCEGPEMPPGPENVRSIGYAEEALSGLPPEVIDSNAGCGAPLEAARLQPGETVLDLGSGAGLDCFLAAKEVGSGGRVLGLDMTEAMLEKAETHRRRMGLENVEFRRGEMESMPIEDESVDVIISNCVINLSPDKEAVFRESFRVLAPGGRFAVSDVLIGGAGPDGEGAKPDGEEADEKGGGSIEEWCACVAGAIEEEAYLSGLRAAGFGEAEILSRKPYSSPGLISATVHARKPVRG